MGESKLGEQFARALAEKDFSAIGEMLDPEVDFRGLTPNQNWQASDPAEVDVVLREWFEEDEIDSLEYLESDAFADCERVGYRFRGSNGDGPFVVEQQAYLKPHEDRIGWVRIICSGNRPADRD